MPFFNTNYTDNDPDKETASLENGRGYQKEDSMTAALGAGSTVLPGSPSVAFLQNAMGYLEDDIYRKLGLQRDSLQNGTNKHSMEILLKDQVANETLQMLRTLRQNHYNHFFEKICTLLSVPVELPVLHLSFIENAKVE